MLNIKYKLDTKVTLKNGRVGIVWACPQIEDKIIYVITLNSGERIDVTEDEILKGENDNPQEVEDEILQNTNDVPDVTEPLEDDYFIFPDIDNDIHRLVNDSLYSDDMYDEIFELEDISKLFQHIPLKYFIYDNEVFIVVANSVNFKYYDGVDIRLAHENICNPGYNQYGLILYHIEMDNTINSLVMQTWDKSRTLPIGILEYAIETAELILINKNRNKIEWLNTNIKYLKKFKNEIKDIPYILELVDNQIIEYENELKKENI